MKKIILTLTISLMTIFSFSRSKTDGNDKRNGDTERNSPNVTMREITDPKKIAEIDNSTGVAYMTGGDGITQNYAEAVVYFRKAAEQGHASAQYNLGNCYARAKGVAQDDVEAAKWFKKSAAQGRPIAQFRLGLCYASGKGVFQDYVEAAKWFKKAAAQGDAGAQYMLGVYYVLGKGVSQNTAESVKWLRKSAAQGDAEAKQLLRDMGF